MPNVATVILYSMLTAAVTGLGIIPLIFSGAIPPRLPSWASAVASGLLLAAAFQLIDKGTTAGGIATIIGLLVGLALIIPSRKWLDRHASPEMFRLASVFEPFLPFGLGLAAGAMIWMIGAEVLPDACRKASLKSIGAAPTAGVIAMLTIQALMN